MDDGQLGNGMVRHGINDDFLDSNSCRGDFPDKMAHPDNEQKRNTELGRLLFKPLLMFLKTSQILFLEIFY